MIKSTKFKFMVITFICLTVVVVVLVFFWWSQKPSATIPVVDVTKPATTVDKPLPDIPVGPEISDTGKNTDVLVPDAVIYTQSLSALPADILKNPILKDLLTEDFIFYYEESEERLSLKGTLRRLAYEHELNIFDKVFSYIFNNPVEVALWKTHDGKLNDFMLIIDRTNLTDLMVAVAKILPDEQLSEYEKKDLAGIGEAMIYKLNYSYSQSLYFVALGDKLIIYSNNTLDLPTTEVLSKWTNSAKALFGKSDGKGMFVRLFAPELPIAKHTVYLSAKYLSFNHQVFFPSLKAIKMQFDQEKWQGYSLMVPLEGIVRSADLWQVTPQSPALCLSLPIDQKKLLEFFNQTSFDLDLKVQALKAPAIICWYADSKLYLPLIMVETQEKLDIASLTSFFSKAIGVFEAGILTAEEKKLLAEQKQMLADGESVDDPVRAKSFLPPFEIMEKKIAEGIVLSREVSSQYGVYNVKNSKNKEQMRSKKYFNVQLAYWNNFLIFSPDNRLVDNAVAVLNKEYPSLADNLSEIKNEAQIIINPTKLAALLKESIEDSLPSEQESIFRESVTKRLFPSLEKLKKISPYVITVPLVEDETKWGVWQWHTLAQ